MSKSLVWNFPGDRFLFPDALPGKWGPLLVAIVVFGFAAPALAEQCRIPDKAPAIEAVSVYQDESGSVISKDALTEKEALLAPLRRDLEYLSAQFEARQYACGLAILEKWADEGAFLGGGPDIARSRHRIRVALAMNVAALRLQKAGLKVEDRVVGWLRELTQDVIGDYHKQRKKITGRNNLQAWSAVVAASYLLLSRDDEIRAYQDLVWRDCIQQISELGYIDAELKRASRSLTYHQYHYSALLMLSKVRASLGLGMSQEELRKLSLLESRIVRGVCDSSSFVNEAPVKLPPQVKPAANAFEIMLVFEDPSTVKELSECDQVISDFEDEFFNGDIRNLPNLIEFYRGKEK